MCSRTRPKEVVVIAAIEWDIHCFICLNESFKDFTTKAKHSHISSALIIAEPPI